MQGMENKGTLLFVDDETAVVRYLGGLFHGLGYTFLSAGSAEAALKIAAARRVDVLCTAIRLPGVSGLELIRAAGAVVPGLQSIVMTGHGEMESVIEALRLGASNHCGKPVDFLEVKNAVERCLSKLRLEREVAAHRGDLERRVALRTAALKKESRERRAAEARYQVIVEGTRDLVIQMNVRGELKFANPAALERLGIRAPELTGKPFLDFVHDEDRPGVRSWLAQVAGGGALSDRTESRLVSVDGTVSHMSWRWSFRHDGESRLGAVSGIGTDVTDLRRAQVKLRESGQRLRRMGEATFEGIVFSAGGRILDANAQLGKMMGYAPEELRGLSVMELVARESREAVRTRIREEYPHAYEHRALKKDGTRIPVEVRGKMVTHDGERVRVTAIRDMTRRKRDRERLIRREERFRAIADYTYNWEIWTDPEGRVLWTNPTVERMTGYTPGEYVNLGNRLRTLIHEEDYPWLRSLTKEILNKRTKGNDIPFRIRKRDGSVLWVSLSHQPIYNDEGTYLGIRSSIRDISERIKMEKQMRREDRRHREAQRIARLGHWELDIPSGNLRWSDEVYRIHDMERDSRPVTLARARKLVHPADRKSVARSFQGSLGERGEHGIEHRLLLSGGRVKYVRMLYRIFHDKGGTPLGASGTVQDITEFRLLENEARDQRERLARADKLITLGTLVAWVAHEVNNPNNFIMLNLPLLEEVYKTSLSTLEHRYETTGDFHMGKMPYSRVKTLIPELLAGIREGALRIRRIVNDLKNYTGPSPSSNMGKIAMDEVLRDALGMMDGYIDRHTDHFSVFVEEGLPPVRGDRIRLEQVVVNLLQNACNALMDRTGEVHATLSHDRERNRVTLSVRDQGCGVPLENLEKIREAFFTTRRDAGGAGLGLASCERIIGDHGGTMTFHTEEGKGTNVLVDLPPWSSGNGA